MRNKYFKLSTVIILLVFAFTAQAAITNPAEGLFVDLSNRGGNTFGNLALVLIQFLIRFVGLLCILFIIWGGFQYITSGMNAELAEAGKKTLRNAIIGLIIVILSYVIVFVVMDQIIRLT